MSSSRRRRLLALLSALIILAAGASIAWAGAAHSGTLRAAQTSPTAVPLVFPTATATQGPPTETPTRTPTSLGRPVIEAISPETNVRAGPDINSNPIGLIFPGTLYPVLGRRFDWFQIEFPNSPSGTAWVYSGVVTLTGEPTLIPELELEDIPTIDPAFIAAQQTALYVSATPGAIATLTAQVLITPTGVFTAAPDSQAPTLVPGAPLPTFTFPPFTDTPVVIPRAAPANANDISNTGVPPIVPILALIALGLMGLIVALLRRL